MQKPVILNDYSWALASESGHASGSGPIRSDVLDRVYSKALDVFGSAAEVRQWVQSPAIGLDDQRPVDLLTTASGIEIVETFLRRLEHGVYV